MYLRVECLFCRISWNYYQEKYRWPFEANTTAVEYLGQKCPHCGYLGDLGGTYLLRTPEHILLG